MKCNGSIRKKPRKVPSAIWPEWIGVTNLIAVKPRVTPTDRKDKIEEAFKRSAEVDAQRITVEVDGSKVELRGTVHSWAERREAARAAASASGISYVDNLITLAA